MALMAALTGPFDISLMVGGEVFYVSFVGVVFNRTVR